MRAPRIEHHIARQFPEVGLLLHKDRLVSTLKDVTYSFMGAIESLRIDTIELTHAFGKVRIRRFHENVVVVAHQTIGVNRPVKTFPDTGDHIEKQLPIAIGQVDIFPAIPPRGDMVKRAGEF